MPLARRARQPGHADEAARPADHLRRRRARRALRRGRGPADLEARPPALREPASGRTRGRRHSGLRHRAGLQPAGGRRGLRRDRCCTSERFAGSALPAPAGGGGSSGAPAPVAVVPGRRRAGPAGAGPAGGRRRLVGVVVGGRRARVGRRRGADERGGSRIGHGVVPRPLHLGRPPHRRRRDRRRRPPGLRLPHLVGDGDAAGGGGGARGHAGIGQGRAGGGGRHRQMAARAPAGRLQRRLRLHQSRG